MKYIFAAFAFFSLVAASVAQQPSYSVTVETYVGSRQVDKFSFEMKEKTTQQKGFDAMMQAKRYRGKGFPHKVLEADAKEKLAAKKLANQIKAEKRKKPLEKAEEKLDILKKRMYDAKDGADTAKQYYENLSAQLKKLEAIVKKGQRGLAEFEQEFKDYLSNFDPQKEIDEKYEAMLRQIPKDSGDIEEIEYGSFCKFKLNKVAGNVVNANISFAYSALLSWFYADGNNNDDIILKHPIFERYEMLGLKNVEMPLNKPFAFVFDRQNDSDSRTLQDALAATTIFGDKSPDTAPSPEAEEPKEKEYEQTFKDSGLYSEMKKKHNGGKNVTIVFTVKKAK